MPNTKAVGVAYADPQFDSLTVTGTSTLAAVSATSVTTTGTAAAGNATANVSGTVNGNINVNTTRGDATVNLTGTANNGININANIMTIRIDFTIRLRKMTKHTPHIHNTFCLCRH